VRLQYSASLRRSQCSTGLLQQIKHTPTAVFAHKEEARLAKGRGFLCRAFSLSPAPEEE